MNGIIEVQGRRFAVCIEQDQDHGAPWDSEDGHGPVSHWGHRAKLPGELVLCKDRGACRFYDYAEACRIALRDGWDAPPFGQGTPRQRAARAARADYERLRRWCSDDWYYIGVVVTELDADGNEAGQTESLWGIESDSGEYHAEVARELAEQIIAAGPAPSTQDEAAELREQYAELLSKYNATNEASTRTIAELRQQVEYLQRALNRADPTRFE